MEPMLVEHLPDGREGRAEGDEAGALEDPASRRSDAAARWEHRSRSGESAALADTPSARPPTYTPTDPPTDSADSRVSHPTS